MQLILQAGLQYCSSAVCPLQLEEVPWQHSPEICGHLGGLEGFLIKHVGAAMLSVLEMDSSSTTAMEGVELWQW